MDRKLLSITLMVAMAFAMVLPIASVSGAPGIPNPDHVFRLSIGNIETVDPHWAYDTASGELIQNIYEPLCVFDKNRTDAFEAAVADWWPGYGVNPGNTIEPSDPAEPGYVETWYFHIRSNVPWQDPAYGYVTPDDVEYSFERGMLMDHSAGPMWMLYEPLTGHDTSYEWDLDEDGNLNLTEYQALATAIDKSVESNSTHVWFNLKQKYAPFQQILSQTWSMVMCRQWCEDHGLWNKTLVETYGWNSTEAYSEFLRTWDPPEPGPLMEQPDAPGPVVPGPVAMGCGPYKLVAINPDPHTGWWTIEKFDDYWRGWAGKHVTRATMKCVEEWATRKAMFFSTDPSLQADIGAVPRSNCPELHVNGDKDGPLLPGFKLYKVTMPILYAVYFTFEVDPSSPYCPKLGADPKPDLFKDRYLRLALIHCVNFTQIIEQVYLGEAEQSPVCMPAGTAYFNASKPKYNIDLDKAVEYLKKAWGGSLTNPGPVWEKGITVKITYNTGNVMRQATAEMIRYNLLRIKSEYEWPGTVNVEVKGVPWATYLDDMRYSRLPVFIVGWLADFPDPHNWFVPFMHPIAGTYARRQKVTYGLDPTSLTENWYEGASYGPPPYTNYLGEYVTEINNTYVAHLIDTAIGGDPETRHQLYEELMDIYYAEATQLPMCYAIARNYMRDWVYGFPGEFNENPIAPGWYFYPVYKEAATTVASVDISAADTIENATAVYKTIQVWHGQMQCGGNYIHMNFTISVRYVSGNTTVLVYFGFFRNDTTVPEWTFADISFPANFTITLGPGESFSRLFMWFENGTMWEGNWTLGIFGSPTAGTGGETVEDTNPANNKHTSPYVVKALELFGDIRPDGEVNVLDAIKLAKAFGYSTGESDFNPDADLKPDGEINILDAIKLSMAFGNKLECELW